MMFKTHLVIGVLLGLVLVSLLNPVYPVLFFGVLVLASLLPDIDTPKSKVGKKVGIVSNILNVTLGHRGLMHSIYLPAVVAIFGVLFGFPLIGYAFAIGYMIHLIADMFTKDGIHLFYPVLNIRGFITTGSIWESFIFFICCGLVILKVLSYLK
ncbi:MAG: metal-dependent hydrolase [archaeon]